MGLFGLFRAKGEPVGRDVVIKRMSAHARDFEGVSLDSESHPVDVFECRRLDVTGRRDIESLTPCRETVSALRHRIKKNQVVAFYLSSKQFDIEFRWRNGGSVRMTASLDTKAAGAFPSWLDRKVKINGEGVTAEALGRMLDGEFTSDAPPAWLNVHRREDAAEPETTALEEDAGLTVADLKPGVEVFGHYKIEQELGSGGQGKVFLATDTQTMVESHRRVVLKVLRCESRGDETSMQEFIAEANTLSSLRDDRIAACYWCNRLKDDPILAMEYIEGVSLDKYLANQKDGKISEKETRDLLLPIAEALDYAHAKGIFHRDVKPPNIIVRKTPKRIGDKDICTCLLDFGIASRDQGCGDQTTFWSVRGTPRYMSPEQRMGARPSASMDVYSLAVTAYECMTGEMPYPDGCDLGFKVPPLKSDTPMSRSIMLGLEMLSENRPATCKEILVPTRTVTMCQPDSMTRKAPEPPPPLPDEFRKLERIFMLYRQLLAQSAARSERENGELAEWFRGAQGALRDLTQDLARADRAAIEQFFRDVMAKKGRMPADDFFPATDRLVEVRSSLSGGGGPILLALKESIS